MTPERRDYIAKRLARLGDRIIDDMNHPQTMGEEARMLKARPRGDRAMTTGEMIRRLSVMIEAGEPAAVSIEELGEWLDCVVTAAAMLDPDNPPLTAEQLVGMKRVRKP